MTTDTPPPRRKWHFTRWLIVLIIATLGWSGWRAYAFRSALAEAKALGWVVEYTEPFERIREDWNAAFMKETWLDGVTFLSVPSGDLKHNLTTARRLNPKELNIHDAAELPDLSALQSLTRLQKIGLSDCPRLTNLDALKSLPALQALRISGCQGLTNLDALKSLPTLKALRISGCQGLTNLDALKSHPTLQEISIFLCFGFTNLDALKNLPALQEVRINGSSGLTPESVAALKTALPNAQITGP